ncbi:hypothetical protein NPIL_458631 [Nephila pilipes]|uniref:Uncharacterized protein n=1 Tax=Nephila pilipes TaxID=299642 RepID=A0A8X6U223_NEPPI|nr:hypothetical protein NPIL_458631 [Nephila pilipes]
MQETAKKREGITPKSYFQKNLLPRAQQGYWQVIHNAKLGQWLDIEPHTSSNSVFTQQRLPKICCKALHNDGLCTGGQMYRTNGGLAAVTIASCGHNSASINNLKDAYASNMIMSSALPAYSVHSSYTCCRFHVLKKTSAPSGFLNMLFESRLTAKALNGNFDQALPLIKYLHY